MIFRLVRALAYATVCIGVLGVVLPARLLRAVGVSPPDATGAPQVVGTMLCGAGAALSTWCLLALVVIGRGTPMPLDPPTRLVVRGPYRFVRNPMYLGAGLALAGAALYFRSFSLAAYGAALGAALHAFVVLYEEKSLSDKFGLDYEAYRRRVARWIPRL